MAERPSGALRLHYTCANVARYLLDVSRQVFANTCDILSQSYVRVYSLFPLPPSGEKNLLMQAFVYLFHLSHCGDRRQSDSIYNAFYLFNVILCQTLVVFPSKV